MPSTELAEVPVVGVTGVTLDSRAVRPGDLYAALPGARVHGATFAADVRDRGAAAVLTDHEGAALMARAGVALPAVVVPQPRAVLGAVAALVHGSPSEHLTMVGITGTNGKTTTAYLVDSAFRALGHVTGLVGTVETRVADERVKSVRTTPESPDLHALFAVMRERGVDTCTMEVSSHALELHRVDPVVYDVAAFTNLSQDHLDFHGTMEAYYAAKAGLFTPQRSASRRRLRRRRVGPAAGRGGHRSRRHRHLAPRGRRGLAGRAPRGRRPAVRPGRRRPPAVPALGAARVTSTS